MIKIEISDGYIKLDQLLKLSGLSQSGAEAHKLITDGLVKVNGQTEYQKRKKIYHKDIVEIDDEKINVLAGKDERV